MTTSVKKILWNIFSALLVLAIFYFLGREFLKNWDQIRSYEFRFNISLLLIASAAYGATFILFSIGWHIILRHLHHPISLKEIWLYFCITQPAKYIPGKIWIPVTRMKFCKPHGVPNSITLLSTGIEGVMEILAGSYVSVITLLQAGFLGPFSIWGTIAISGFGLVLLCPPVFYFFINLYLRIVKQPFILKNMRASFRQLLLLQVIYVFGMLGLGVSQFLFLQSFAPIPMQYAILLISIGTFSVVASIIAFFAPAGLGVREGIWFMALKSISVPSVALIFAFVSRLWMVVVEALLTFIALPIFLLQQRKARMTNALRPPL